MRQRSGRLEHAKGRRWPDVAGVSSNDNGMPCMRGNRACRGLAASDSSKNGNYLARVGVHAAASLNLDECAPWVRTSSLRAHNIRSPPAHWIRVRVEAQWATKNTQLVLRTRLLYCERTTMFLANAKCMFVSYSRLVRPTRTFTRLPLLTVPKEARILLTGAGHESQNHKERGVSPVAFLCVVLYSYLRF